MQQGGWIYLYNFKLDNFHSTTNSKIITLSNRSVRFQKVWFQINIKQISTDTFNCIINRQYVNTRSIFNIRTRMYNCKITESATLLIPILLFSMSSSAITTNTVSLLSFPLTRTVSLVMHPYPRNNSSSSMVAVFMEHTELSSLVPKVYLELPFHSKEPQQHRLAPQLSRTCKGYERTFQSKQNEPWISLFGHCVRITSPLYL